MHRGTVALAALLLGGADAAHAWRLEGFAELGLLHSDNIDLDAERQVSQNVLVPRIGLTLVETGSTVQAQVAALVEYRDYLGGAYASDTRGSLDAAVNWSIVPERFAWTFADNLGLYPVDLRAPDTPSNLQQVNVFSTGPTWRMRLAPNTTGQAELRYADARAEEDTGFDSSRYAAAYRLSHALSPSRNLLGNVEFRQVDFDNDLLATDYDRWDVHAGYTQTLSALDIALAAGWSRLSFDDGRSASGPLVRANLDWRAARHTLGVAVAWQFSDAASQLVDATGSLRGPLGAVGIGHVDVSPYVFEERRVTFRHAYEGARLVAGAHAYAARIAYEQVTTSVSQDRDDLGGGVDVAYRLRPLLRVGALAGTERRDYRGTGTRDTDRYYGVYLAQQWARHWSWRLDLTRNERNSDLADLTYDENVAYVRVTYTL